jgi:hypothetical protein
MLSNSFPKLQYPNNWTTRISGKSWKGAIYKRRGHMENVILSIGM